MNANEVIANLTLEKMKGHRAVVGHGDLRVLLGAAMTIAEHGAIPKPTDPFAPIVRPGTGPYNRFHAPNLNSACGREINPAKARGRSPDENPTPRQPVGFFSWVNST
jgi:hypothetical protein